MIWLYFTWLTILFGMEVVAFLSGRKSAKKAEQRPESTIALTLCLEKKIPGKLAKEIKEIQRSKNEIDNKTFMKLIKDIVNPPQKENEEKPEHKKEPNELQEK